MGYKCDKAETGAGRGEDADDWLALLQGLEFSRRPVSPRVSGVAGAAGGEGGYGDMLGV